MAAAAAEEEDPREAALPWVWREGGGGAGGVGFGSLLGGGGGGGRRGAIRVGAPSLYVSAPYLYSLFILERPYLYLYCTRLRHFDFRTLEDLGCVWH